MGVWFPDYITLPWLSDCCSISFHFACFFFCLFVCFVLFCFFQDFHFRQLRKVSIGDPAVAPELRYSLLCTSNEFGLTFVGCGGGVYVFETSVLYDVDQDETIGPRNAIAGVSSLKATLIPTHVPPLHVSLSCDSLTLCVALRENSIIKCLFYDTRAITLKGAPITPFATTDLSTQQDHFLNAQLRAPFSPWPGLTLVCIRACHHQQALRGNSMIFDTQHGHCDRHNICQPPEPG